MPKPNKIVKLSLEKSAHQLKTDGYSDNEIAQELSKIAGEKISRYSVLRYFQSNKDPIIQKAKQREEVVEKAIDNRLDIVNQLNRINKLALYILSDALKDKDYNKALKAIREVREQIEFQSKLLGDLPDQEININVDLIQEQFNEFKQIILEGMCQDCKKKVSERLYEIVNQ